MIKVSVRFGDTQFISYLIHAHKSICCHKITPFSWFYIVFLYFVSEYFLTAFRFARAGTPLPWCTTVIQSLKLNAISLSLYHYYTKQIP